MTTKYQVLYTRLSTAYRCPEKLCFFGNFCKFFLKKYKNLLFRFACRISVKSLNTGGWLIFILNPAVSILTTELAGYYHRQGCRSVPLPGEYISKGLFLSRKRIINFQGKEAGVIQANILGATTSALLFSDMDHML